MQHVAIIELSEWQSFLKKQEVLEQRLQRLEKGLAEYVDTKEAERITGIGRDALYNARMAEKIEYKYEGRKVLYLRTSLEAYNETSTPRRKRA